MRKRSKWLTGVAAAAALTLVAAGCSSDDDSSSSDTTAGSAVTTTAPGDDGHDDGDDHEVEVRTLTVPAAAITVDGDPSDWADITGLDVTLEAIEGVDGVEPRDTVVTAAHDDENLYMLFEVTDDYKWNADDAKLSAAAAVMFPVSTGAGEHMGADDEVGTQSTGMVDIWHWELGCAAGEPSGGGADASGSIVGTGDDEACNFDDEWSTDARTREDDDTATAENSLLGVWTHSNPVEGEDGTWYFEMSRPLQTGDEQDAQFAVGESTLLALAYWDPDFSPEGWEDDTHAQSSNQGWIELELTA